MKTLNYPVATVPDLKLQTSQTTYGDYYYFKEGAQIPGEVTLIGGGVEHCKSDYSVERETYIYYAIEYIASGSCCLKMGGQEYQLGAGSIFCYGPHQAYEIESVGDDPLIKYFINFSVDESFNCISQKFLFGGTPIRLKNLKWIGDTFLQIQDCGSSDRVENQQLCHHLLKYLISRVEASDVKIEGPISPSYVTYQTCRSYIESRYLKIRSISEVAEACNISICHVSRLFKKYGETSPCTLLTSLKLNRSRELLKGSDLLIKQVAQKVGIDDQYYFSNRFKQFFGVSPQNYKRKLQQESFSAA